MLTLQVSKNVLMVLVIGEHFLKFYTQGFLREFMSLRRPPNGDLLSESPPIWEPLTRMDAQSPPLTVAQDSNQCAWGSLCLGTHVVPL